MELQKERMQPGCELGGNDTRETEALSSRLGLKIEEGLAIVVFLGREELRGERIDFFPSTLLTATRHLGTAFCCLNRWPRQKKRQGLPRGPLSRTANNRALSESELLLTECQPGIKYGTSSDADRTPRH